MRTIKFRGKAIEPSLGWIYGDLLQISNIYPDIHRYKDTIEVNGEKCKRYELDKVSHKTVGQFTGAFDCEGREIYEGDILSACYGHSPNITEVTGVVEFVHCGFALRFGKDAGVWLDQLIHAEIVGNIHDNPELLKGGNQ